MRTAKSHKVLVVEDEGLIAHDIAARLEAIGHTVVVTGPSGRVRLMNRAAEVLTGWTASEAEGQPIARIVALSERDSDSDAADPVSLAILRDAPVQLTRDWTLLARDGRQMKVEG